MEVGDCFIHGCVLLLDVSTGCVSYSFQNVFFLIIVFGLLIMDF